MTRLGFRIALLLLGTGVFDRKSGGKTAALQNHSSHSSMWRPLESFQEAPATKWRWRGKTSGFKMVSQSGTWEAVVFGAAVAVVFSEIFLASVIQRFFRPVQSIF